MEALGPGYESACEFLNNLGRKVGDNTGDDRSTSFLFQRISVLTFGSAFQRSFAKWQFNVGTPPGLVFIPATTISLIFYSTFGYFLTEGLKNNNNNTQDNVCDAVIVTKSLREFICWMENSANEVPTLRQDQA